MYSKFYIEKLFVLCLFFFPLLFKKKKNYLVQNRKHHHQKKKRNSIKTGKKAKYLILCCSYMKYIILYVHMYIILGKYSYIKG